jgi:hemerythrin superfamily protein
MTAKQQDIVDLLEDRHHQIEVLFNKLSSAKDEERRRALFEDLVGALAVHESAEEIVVHPAVRSRTDAGNKVVEDRLREESEAKHALAELYDLGLDHREFDNKLAALSKAVLAHADHEKKHEFPALREALPDEELRQLAESFKAAESIAPTRPHAIASESAIANLVTGPPLAVFDRIRDAMDEWRRSYANTQEAVRSRSR